MTLIYLFILQIGAGILVFGGIFYVLIRDHLRDKKKREDEQKQNKDHEDA